ncbi:uncharacterized protein LOC102804306, partial [Saccoglossus kowalevskii]|uniref:Uncharacterized protein LOC102804306 n=1 Tax=Saccoglossus kowalevskii TaxID=10224 RepID=A0ABM0MTM5_SACKO
LEIYGIFYLVHSQPSPENVLRKCRKLIPVDTKDFLGSDKLLVLHIEHDNVTIDESSFYWYHPSNGQAENCEVNIVDDSHLPDEMMTFRIKANLLLQFDYMKPKDALESLSVEIEELCDKIASPSSAYHIENSSLVMKCDHSVDDVTVTEMSRETPCERILEHIYLEEDDDFDTIVKAKGGKKKGKNRSKASV